MKRILTVALLAALSAVPAWAATDGSTEAKAVTVTAKKAEQVKSVTLVKGTGKEDGVFYLKMKLSKKTAYTVWLSDADEGVTLSQPYGEIGNIWNAPSCTFERAEVGDTVRWVVTGKQWGDEWADDDWDTDFDWGDDSDMDWGDDWKTTISSTWWYYIRVAGPVGATAKVHYVIGNKLPVGIAQNPLVLTPKTSAQTTGDLSFFSSNYYVRVAMTADRRYRFATAGGAEGNILSVQGLPDDIVRHETGAGNDDSAVITPDKSGTYTFFVQSTSIGTFPKELAKLTYSVDATRTLAEHVKEAVALKVNESFEFVPGRMNAKGNIDKGIWDGLIDERFFSFKSAKGVNYVVGTEGATTNLLLCVYDAKGNVLARNRGDGSGFDVRAALAATSKATQYYIGVCQDLGGDDDLLEPTAGAVRLTVRPVAPIAPAAVALNPTPTDVNVLATAADPGLVAPVLGTNAWYETLTIAARKGITYALGTTFVSEESATDFHLRAVVTYVASGKTKTVVSADLTPGAPTNSVVFKAAATATYSVRIEVKEGRSLDYPAFKVHSVGYLTSGEALGRLTVIPEGTVKATWTLDKEKVKYGIGASILLPGGKSHTVCFAAVSGYKTPAKKTVSIVSGATVTVEREDARYVDSCDPADEARAKATNWKISTKKTSFVRTLWANDKADVFKLSSKDGRYYDIALSDVTGDAVFSIDRADGVNIVKDVTSVSRLLLPGSKATTYYVTVQHGGETPADGVYTLSGSYAEVGTVAFAKSTVSVKDTDTYVTLTVKRTAKAGAIAVDYATEDSSAKAGEHYVPTSGRLTWKANDKSSRTIRVKLIPKLLAAYDVDRLEFYVNLTAAESDYEAQVTTPYATIVRTQTAKMSATAPSVYAKAAAKPKTVKKTENAALETGTFYGVLEETDDTLTNGLPQLASVTLTSTAATAKKAASFSAKVMVGGATYAFSDATGWDAPGKKTLRQVTKVNKVAYTNELSFTLTCGQTTNEDAWAENVVNAAHLKMNVPDKKGVQTVDYDGTVFRRNAAIQSYLTAMTNFVGYYTAALVPAEFRWTDRSKATSEDALPNGRGYLTLKIDGVGKVSYAGLLADGTKISGSAPACALERTKDSVNGWRMWVPVFQVKSPVCFGGVLALVAQADVCTRSDGRAYKLVVSSGIESQLVWNNDSAALTRDGLQGWRIGLCPAGGWYDTVFNLQNYYRDRTFSTAVSDEFPTESLASGYQYVTAADPDDLTVDLAGNALGTASRSLVTKDKKKKLYDLAAESTVNACNVQVKFERATGLVSGSFALWSQDAAGTKQVQTTLKHYGVLTLDRADANPLENLYKDREVFTSGFYLQSIKVPLTKKTSRAWAYSQSFDIVAEKITEEIK